MKKAFVIVLSDTQVEEDCDVEIRRVRSAIFSRTALVVTRECCGEGVILAGKIITSLYLVRNHPMVKVVLPDQSVEQAFVARKDEGNNIAELKMVTLGKVKPKKNLTRHLRVASPGGIGDPLLIPQRQDGNPVLTVAGMSFFMKVCERKGSDWKVRSLLPEGLAGGGIWNLYGDFTGMMLTTKTSLSNRPPGSGDMLLALSGETVMEFAESN